MTPPPVVARRSSGSRVTIVALAVAAAVVVADQASKYLVRLHAADLPFHLGWGVGIDLASNPGVSFGRLTGSPGFILIAVAVLAACLAVAVVVAPQRYRLALGVLLGGAVGNLVDRVRFGAVVDFIDVPRWPTFNVADAAIAVGVVVLVVQVLRGQRA